MTTAIHAEVLDTALTQASDEAKARFADSALLTRYDELVVAQHEYAATERLRSEQAVTSRSLDRTRLVSQSTTLGATQCSLCRGTIEVPSRRQSR
jgi:hypothetical protein